MNARLVKTALRNSANTTKAAVLQRFFKTGKGEYGQGDVFLGVAVPLQRKIARQYVDLPLEEVKKLLISNIHEYRMTALLILVYKNKQSDGANQKKIFNFYVAHTKWINNWDLVDVTCRDIVGGYLFDSNRTILYTFARSRNVWKRRIAIVSTWYFIRQHQYQDTCDIAEILLRDDHPLIHKAVGWMLRELSKYGGQQVLDQFLEKNARSMPRTMLRYAIELLEEKKRKSYLTRR